MIIFDNKRHVIITLFVFFAWVLVVVLFFDKFAYEINDFNSNFRLLVTTGEPAIREFDSNGLPISFSARTGEKFISPFYVIHYGLIYSDVISDRSKRTGFHWRHDSSTEFWNVQPKIRTVGFFKNSADWIVSNVDYTYGRAHLIYNFDWPYRNYPNGMLKSPWWSGLTDGYAIILLLRAYDVFNDVRYLNVAQDLYKSVLTPIHQGGSLNNIDENLWIEEYVDPKVDGKKMSFVLNGMIYSTYGIDAYEKFFNINKPIAPKLYNSIACNLEIFNKGVWSYYDAIGNVANMKYHRIHVALLADLESLTNKREFKKYKAMWFEGAQHPGLYWIINSSASVSKSHYLVLLCSVMFSPLIIIILLNKIIFSGKVNCNV